MSIFSWLMPKKPAKVAPPPSSSGLSRMDSTKPFSGSKQAQMLQPNAQPANRKNERMARRELLYGVVREAMVRAGVLSSSYKFKVLSLDARGRQFLVMIDLSRGAGGETGRLAEIEALIAQGAKSRYDILVTAVYWRSNEHVAVGDPASRSPIHTHSHGPTSRPAALDSMPFADSLPPVAQPESVSQPAELAPAPERGRAQFDPLHPDEVEAFKRALATAAVRNQPLPAAVATPATPAARPQPAAARPAAASAAKPEIGLATTAAHATARTFDGSAKSGPQSYTLLTGFEDTEMPEQPEPTGLSATQYGELR
ncbi:hypothetical protein FN976_12645 [Caenimonas sedimenti]|uniref:Uncharacterized protein n=1 Tax=Caenimonas sedimenti TaxID=2596921 RepID=A0A562ZRD4_9BURK|nr:hypothetical protein [Caenimonas sedimenti]TWO71152.1 hypothetical protein FN976_12645 [Caenimonas sedimenti]